jgi:hypothetical protein
MHRIFYILIKKCEVLLVDKLLEECRGGHKEKHLDFVASWKLRDQSGTRTHSLMEITNFEDEFIRDPFL